MAISKRSSRKNNGISSTVFNVRPSLPKTLENAYLAERAAEAEAKRKAKEDSKPKHRGKECAIPVMMLLQIRALREYFGWSYKQLEVFFSLPRWRVEQVCQYHVAPAAVPKKDDAPIGAVPPDIPDKRTLPRKARPLVPPMQGTLRSPEEVRAQRAADAMQAALLEAELSDPAELRLSDES